MSGREAVCGLVGRGLAVCGWAGRGSAVCALVALLLGGAAACKNAEPAPEPTEPWPAHSGATRTGRAASLVRVFDVAGGEFSFRIPGKAGEVRGKVTGLGGAFTVDLNQLEATRGTVQFDLTTTEVADPSDAISRGASDAASDAASSATEWTTSVRTWLGVGETTASPSDRAKDRYGRFEVDSIHEPSDTRVDVARASARPGSSDPVQRVVAFADGRLVVRGFSVARRVGIEVDFHFTAGAPPGSEPTRIRVRLRGVEKVPLAEHGLQPPKGFAPPSPRESFVPLLVGKSALVSGEIALAPRLR